MALETRNGNLPRKKAVALWRVSSREQRQGYSVDSQRRQGLEYAVRANLEVVKEFDAAESARKKGRKDYAECVKFLQDHPDVEIFLVEKIDRLSRNHAEYVMAIDLVEEHGKQIHLFFPNRILHQKSLPSDWFVSDIDLSVSRFTSMHISFEARKGLREKAAQGLYPSSAPFAYLNDKASRNIYPDPERAPLFSRMGHLYATGHYSISQIDNRAYNEGLRSRKGNRIARNSWWLYFQNPVYAGSFYWEGSLHKGNYEPLWSWETHLALLKALRRDGKPKGKGWGTKPEIVFRGLGRCTWPGCPDPGRVLTGEGPNKNNPDYVYYHCSIHSKPALSQDRLAKALGEALKSLEIPADIVDWVRVELKKDHGKEREFHDATVRSLENEYNRLDSMIDKSYQDKLEGKINDEYWQRRSNEWKSRQMDVQAQLAGHRNIKHDYLEDGVRLLELSQRIATLYFAANYEEKRELIEIVLSNFVFDGVTVSPVWSKPFDAFVEAAHSEKWLGR